MSNGGVEYDSHSKGEEEENKRVFNEDLTPPVSEISRLNRWESLAEDGEEEEENEEDWEHKMLSRIYSVDEEIQMSEWVNDDSDNTWLNLRAAWRDLSQGWSFEHFVVTVVLVLSTVLFYYLPPNSQPIAVRLDFTFVFTSLLYLFVFNSQVTFRRRDEAMMKLANIHSLLCQMHLAMLLWNRDRDRPSAEFEQQAHDNFTRLAECCFRLLRMPTAPDLTVVKRHQRFRMVLRKRTQELRNALTHQMIATHLLLEDCKETQSIEAGETARITYYARKLQVEMEQIQLLKEYRTSPTVRDFARVMVLICPAVWGVYFNMMALDSATFGFAFVLAIASIVITLLLVNMIRAAEDPFLSVMKGENLRIDEECTDTLKDLLQARRYCSVRRKRHPRERAKVYTAKPT